MARRRFKYAVLNTLGPPLIAGAVRLYRRLIRIEYRNAERMLDLVRQGKALIFVFWHGDLLQVAFAYMDMKKRRLGRSAILASQSPDGELLARTVGRLGVEAVRGSSSRGGLSSLKGLGRFLRDGGHIGIAVDGPVGPRRRAKAGAVALARETGAPILPFSLRYTKTWRVGSWDRTEIPRPFSRCVATFHEPITVAHDAGRDEIERVRKQIEEVLLSGEKENT